MLAFGGGAVVPPLLGLLLGMPQHVAQAVSLGALLPPVGLPALLAYRRAGVRPDVPLALALVAGFAGAAPGGAWLANRLPAPTLRLAFAAFLVVLGVRALRAKPPSEDGARGRLPWVVGVPIGAAAGALSGLLGIAGGVVVVALLHATGRVERLVGQATAQVMMLPPLGLPALLVYAREQPGLPWGACVAVAAGFVVGSGVGGRVAVRVRGPAAARIYAVALVGLAAATLLR